MSVQGQSSSHAANGAPSGGPRRSRRRWGVAGVIAALAGSLTFAPSAYSVGESLTAALSQTTGTAPFDGDNLAGNDSSQTNGIVRTNDTVTYNIEILVADAAATSTTFTLLLPKGAEMAAVPAYCLAGSSLSPATLPAPTVPVTPTSWQALPSQVLTCNVGNRVANSTVTYPVVARVRAEVPNGTPLTPDGTAATQVTASVVTTDVTTPAVSNSVAATVSARAKFDLSKNGFGTVANSHYSGRDSTTCSFDPSRACYRYYMPLTIQVADNGKGVSPLASPFTFTDDLSPASLFPASYATDPDWLAAADPLASYGARLVSCNEQELYDEPGSGIGRPARYGFTGVILTAANSVRDSGVTTCSQAGGPGTPVTFTVTGADTTALTVPSSAAFPPTAIPAGTGMVYSTMFTFEVPLDATRDLGTTAGEATTFNMLNVLKDFTPTDIGGTVNDPASQLSFNDTQTATGLIANGVGFNKFFVGIPNDPYNTPPAAYNAGQPGYEGPPSSVNFKDGKILGVSGQRVISMLNLRTETSTTGNVGSFLACDGWDPTKMNLAADNYPAVNVASYATFQRFGSGGAPVWVSGYFTSNTYPAVPPTLIVEYGQGTAGIGMTCNDADSTVGWKSNPADAAFGNDPTQTADGVYTGVNLVRVHIVLPSSPTSSGTDVGISIGLQLADQPVGTIVPNYGSVKILFGPDGFTRDQVLNSTATNWVPTTYNFEENSGNLGDRITMTEVYARIVKEVKDPDTGVFGATTPAVTGNDLVDFRITPTVTAPITVGATADTFIEDCLPLNQVFVSSTPAVDIAQPASPPGSEILCAAGETYLRWNLGEQPVNAVLVPIVYTVRISAGATSGVKTNRALITAAGDASLIAQRSDDAAVQVVQPAGIVIDKIPLTPLVEVNRSTEVNKDHLLWSVEFTNIDTSPGPSNVDIVDVLPKLGLNGSDFDGTLVFDSATVTAGNEMAQPVEILYTKAPTINVSPSHATNGALGSTVWCSTFTVVGPIIVGSGVAATDCPASAAQVTGLRIRRVGVFGPADQIAVTVQMTPTGNTAGDIYANQTAGDAVGLQLEVGPVVATETITASQIGDLVFDDANANGVQDIGEAGISGFGVQLSGTDSDGNPVLLTTVTDAGGIYSFPNLQSGNYIVTFTPASLLANQHFTVQKAGTDDEVDSDGNTLTGVTGPIVLAPNTVDSTWDQGVFTANPEIMLVKYINENDANTAPGVGVGYGSTMNVTFDITNTGNMRLAPVVLTDDTIDVADIACPETALDPAATMTCTATYPAPAPGVQHTNIATVIGTPVVLADGTELDDVNDTDLANAYVPAGGVSITKSVVGPERFPGYAYEFGLACTYNQVPLTLPATDAKFTIVAGATKAVANLPQMAVCIATELEAGGANSTTGAVNGGAASTGSAFTVTVGSTTSTFAFVNTFFEPASPTTIVVTPTPPPVSTRPPTMPPAGLPATGGDVGGLLFWAKVSLALGSAILIGRRRHRAL